jgi:hypothetical protein
MSHHTPFGNTINISFLSGVGGGICHNPSTWGGEARVLEFEASPGYITSSRLAWAP